MFFKKKKEKENNKETVTKYPFNTDVTFDVAFRALKDGYIIKHANLVNTYLIKISDKVFYLKTSQPSSSIPVEEIQLFDMFLDTWQIIERNKI